MDIRRGDKIVFKKLEEMPQSVTSSMPFARYARVLSGMTLTALGSDFMYVYFTDGINPLFAFQVCDDMIDYIIRDQENVQYEDSEDLSDFLGSFEVVT